MTTASAEGGFRITIDLPYLDGGKKDIKAAYERDVHQMTIDLGSDGTQHALEAVLGG